MLFLVLLPLLADAERPLRPVNTYSIVARDAETGELGVAVQSHWFSVGSGVLWAEPGIGAVATQSFTDPSYGPLGLQLMRAGKSAAEALVALLAADEHANVRQVGMVDNNGVVANHTGENSIDEYCDMAGATYTVQANLMWKPTVCEVMAAAYEASDGDLAERLMVALEAAQGEGGDIRVAANSRPPCWSSAVKPGSRPGAGDCSTCASMMQPSRLSNCGACSR
jgi:uncharacterized Ntn-hydrolase superfamily protein